MTNIDQLRKLDAELSRVLDKEKAVERSEADKDFIEEQIESAVSPILEMLAEQNNTIKETIGELNNKLEEQSKSFDKSIQTVSEAIKAVKIDSPVVNVPEIKIPELKMPEINVPKTDIQIDTKGIEKTLTEAFKGIKQPIVNVPKANIEVKVPKMDFKWPEGDMSVKGIMELAGVNVENPLPVQLRDSKGKPVDFNVGGGTSSRSGGGPIKNESGPISQENPITVTDGFNLSAYDYVAITETPETQTTVYKRGGASGVIVGIIKTVYVDESRATVLTITKT